MNKTTVFSAEAFAEKLIYLRLSNRYTQKDLARLLNIDRSTYAYYELAKTQPKLEIIVQLLAIYHVSADYLLGIHNFSSQAQLIGDKNRNRKKQR